MSVAETKDYASLDIDAYFAAKKAVHKIFNYVPNCMEIPLDDQRGMYWMLTNGEGRDSSCVLSPAPLTAKSIRAGRKIYGNDIYTQRFLSKWVYRSEHHVLVSVDTRTDGNKFLMILDAALECKDQELRDLYTQLWRM